MAIVEVVTVALGTSFSFVIDTDVPFTDGRKDRQRRVRINRKETNRTNSSKRMHTRDTREFYKVVMVCITI